MENSTRQDDNASSCRVDTGLQPAIYLNPVAIHIAHVFVTQALPVAEMAFGVFVTVATLVVLRATKYKKSVPCFYMKMKVLINIGSMFVLLQRLVVAAYPPIVAKLGPILCREYFVVTRLFVSGLPIFVNVLIVHDRFAVVMRPIYVSVALTLRRARRLFAVGALLLTLHALLGACNQYTPNASYEISYNCAFSYPALHRIYLLSDVVLCVIQVGVLLTLTILASVILRKHQISMLNFQPNRVRIHPRIPLQMTWMMLVSGWMCLLGLLPFVVTFLIFRFSEFGRNLLCDELGRRLQSVCRASTVAIGISLNIVSCYVYLFGCRRFRADLRNRVMGASDPAVHGVAMAEFVADRTVAPGTRSIRPTDRASEIPSISGELRAMGIDSDTDNAGAYSNRNNV